MKKNDMMYSHLTRAVLKWFIMIKMLSIIIISSVLQVSAGTNLTYSQTARLNLKLSKVDLEQVIWSIKKQTEFSFFYSTEEVRKIKDLDVNVENVTAEEVLDQCLRGTNLTYEIVNKAVIIKVLPFSKNAPLTLPAEQSLKKRITGTVKDAKGVPLPGVTVVVKGTTIGTITDTDGNFTLMIPQEAKSLLFSFVGLESQELQIGVKLIFNVQLKEAPVEISDVVVVGYGTQKKTTITGSVSAVQSQDLIKSPVANISNALVGKLSGVLTFQQSSEPGVDNIIMRIRGASTFGGSTEPLLMVDGVEVSNINNIDPYEVESVTVLKDASSTAVYGVRGANGVMLITTKRGSVGKPKFSLTSNAALTTFTETRKRMDAYDWTRLNNEALKYDSYISGVYNPPYSSADIEHWRLKDDPIFHPDADWMKYFFKDKTWQQNHNLSVSGGTEKVKYFLSVGYLEQFGQLNNTKLIPDFYDIQINYKRYNFRSNFDFNISKRLTAVVNISSQIEDKRGMNGDYESAVRFISLSSPITTPGVVNGKFVYLPGISALNPVLSMYQQGYRKQYRNNLSGLIRLNYKLDYITEGLSTHGQISYNTYNIQNLTYSPSIQQFAAIRTADGSTVFEPSTFPGPTGIGENTDKRRLTSSEFGFDYARSFGPHNVSALLLYNQSKLFSPALAFLIPMGVQGVVGRATYDYKKRYLAEFDFGYNGTENFAPGKRFGYFPAYSAGWVLSEEPFFPKNNIVTFAKIRGSYGEVGNDKINSTDRFLYRPDSYVYSSADAYYYGEAASSYNMQNGSQEAKIGNPGVIWERAKKTDLGIELNLFKNKLRISADYFMEHRDNILSTKQTVPMLFGGTLPALNFGKMKNSGIDGEITYNGTAGKFNYWFKGNYTFAHNVILEKDEVTPLYAYQRYTGQSLDQKMAQVNIGGLYNTWDQLNPAYRPQSSFNGNRQQPGDVILKDVNGDGKIDSYDCVPLGYSWFPEISYGFSLGGQYKGFDFSVLFQGDGNVSFMPGFANQFGGWIAYQVSSGWASSGQTAAPAYLVDQTWTQERYAQGLPSNFPHVAQSSTVQQQNFQWSTYWHRDASYLRLKNAEIGYTFKGGLLNRIGLTSARLYVNGNNLITWDKLLPGWDPETFYYSGNFEPYPKVRVFNIGANINF